MTYYFPPDDDRRNGKRRWWLWFRKPKNRKLDFPFARQDPPFWKDLLLNSITGFFVNILSTLAYPSLFAGTIAVIAIVKHWIG